MADIVLDFANKIRNKPVSAGFLRSLNTALTATDPRLGARIISGGQPPKGKGGRRTGSTRHDVDKTGHAHTGDLVLTLDGRDVLPGDDKALYANFFRNAAPFFPGIGHYPWGIHVGSGSTAAWGPTKTRRSLDPVFARAIRAGRTGRKPKEVAQGAVADITPIIAPDSAIPRPKPNPRGIRPEDAAAPPVNVVQFAQDAAGTFIEPAGGAAFPGAVPVPAAAATAQSSQGRPDAPGAAAVDIFDPTQFGAVLIEEPVAATATGGADVGPVSPAPLPEAPPPAPPVAAPAADPAVTPAGAAGVFDPTQFGAVAIDDDISQQVQDQVVREAKDNPRQPPRDITVGQALQEAIQGEQLAASQGVQPTVRNPLTGDPNFQLKGEFVQFDGENKLRDPEGNIQDINPETDLVLLDPSTGEQAVFARNADMEEPKILSAFRLLAPGFLAGPVSARASQGITQAARARTLPRSEVARAAQNVQRAERVGSQEQLLDDATRTGVTPSLALIRGGQIDDPSVGTATQVLSNLPFVGSRTARALRENVAEIGEGVSRVTGRLGGEQTIDEAGTAIQEGIRRFKNARNLDDVTDEAALVLPSRSTSFAKKQQALYGRVDRLIPSNAPVAMSASREAIDGLRSKIGVEAFDKIFSNNRLDDLAQAIQSTSELTWEAARTLRTNIRQVLKNSDEFGRKLSDGDVDKVYNALTKDLLTTARNVGGDPAVNAIQRADKFTRAGQKRIQDSFKQILDAKTPEAAFAKILSASKTQGGNVQLLQRLRRSLSKDEFNDVVATLINRMGKPTAGASDPLNRADFSVNTFLTEFSKLSDKAKGIMFSGADKGIRQDFDSLVRVAAARKNVDRLANPSRSGVFGNIGLFLAGSAIEPTSALAAAITGAGASRLISSPKFIKWLNKVENARLPSSSIRSERAARSFANQRIEELRLIGEQEPDLAEGVSQILGVIQRESVQAETPTLDDRLRNQLGSVN